MSVYYSFISGLPDLEFDPRSDVISPGAFLKKLENLLPAEEMEYVRLLRFQKFHNTLWNRLTGIKRTDELLPDDLPGSFSSGSESFQDLPGYLRRLIIWREGKGLKVPESQIPQKLQYFYFDQLLHSRNRFLQQWGESELNRLNFLAARRSELLPSGKENKLIEGNDYYDLLLEFSVVHKIIRTEFSDAAELEKLSTDSNTNYLEREMEIDRLRWNSIDRINRFEYFTIDVILGYFQKLLLLERWKEIFSPGSTADPVKKAAEMLMQAEIL